MCVRESERERNGEYLEQGGRIPVISINHTVTCTLQKKAGAGITVLSEKTLFLGQKVRTCIQNLNDTLMINIHGALTTITKS